MAAKIQICAVWVFRIIFIVLLLVDVVVGAMLGLRFARGGKDFAAAWIQHLAISGSVISDPENVSAAPTWVAYGKFTVVLVFLASATFAAWWLQAKIAAQRPRTSR
jgi:hypothetical protein